MLLVVGAMAGLLGACTTSEAGTPSGDADPTTTSGEPPSSTSSNPPSVDVPPRPRDLSLDGLDPCTLFTDKQRAQLRIDDVRPDDGSGSGTIYEDMKQCTLDVTAAEPFNSYDVVAVTDVDFTYWLDENTNADAELISIAGYPAAQFHIKGGGTHDCAIAVGVAENQHLHVEMLPLDDNVTGDAICQGSKQAAEMALQTLQTLK